MAESFLWRQPTAFERELIDTILAGKFPFSETLCAQIGNVRVADDCACGCHSLAFEVDAGAPVLPTAWTQEFSADDDNGGRHSLFFHTDEHGRVHCLDHVRWNEDVPGEPLVDSLRVCDLEPAGPGATHVVPRTLTIVEELG